MTIRIASLRIWLLAAMLIAGVAGLVGARFAIDRIQESEEETGDRAKDLRIAQSIAARVGAGAELGELQAIQSVLPYDQIIVEQNGREIFVGPAIMNTDFELDATVSFPGGRVVVRDYNTPQAGWPLEVTLAVGGVILLVITAAWVTASVLTQALRTPVNRAVAAADRVAGGDLEARIGEVAPEELARLANAFDSMAARLQAADHDQREFLADVAHEIATPVNAIAGLANALADGTVVSRSERAEAGALIEAETARLASLLEDLRRLTKLDLAEPVGEEVVDLTDLGRSIQTRFARAAASARVDLSVTMEPHQVITDRRLIETVVDNLVSNAIRYTPAGGHVEIRLIRRGDHIELVVTDSGIGIDRADIERIFDRFYRVDGARDRVSGGSGLGLALARRAAHALGARIEVSSDVGRGSEFRMILSDPRA
ncbi:MAG: HAMP domain-containing sensor histidine kinase [Actinomycetota bacterium]